MHCFKNYEFSFRGRKEITGEGCKDLFLSTLSNTESSSEILRKRSSRLRSTQKIVKNEYNIGLYLSWAPGGHFYGLKVIKKPVRGLFMEHI